MILRGRNALLLSVLDGDPAPDGADVSARRRVTDHLDQWPAVSLVALALITMLGAKYYAGVKLGPQGMEVQDG